MGIVDRDLLGQAVSVRLDSYLNDRLYLITNEEVFWGLCDQSMSTINSTYCPYLERAYND
jgi:hypothetical protein